MGKVKLYLTQHKNAITVIIGAIAVVLVVLIVGHSQDKIPQKADIVSTDTLNNSIALSHKLNVSPADAVKIQREIQIVQQKEPVVSYYVQAPDINLAARQTQKAINDHESSLPAIVNEKSDRTMVIPNEESQKVDVYKVNLEKSHKIKAGMTVIEDKLYPTVGYQAGQFEGLVHLKDNGIKGASILYTVVEW
ncbi:hypothetical protein [Veillonella ratti]|uniref:hypothetical protein n=1 Tax=Veillonella ratti TaxID=103892 RepID=UPI000F8CFF4E|nr:hypothetical protein [Veillonella ratti]